MLLRSIGFLFFIAFVFLFKSGMSRTGKEYVRSHEILPPSLGIKRSCVIGTRYRMRRCRRLGKGFSKNIQVRCHFLSFFSFSSSTKHRERLSQFRKSNLYLATLAMPNIEEREGVLFSSVCFHSRQTSGGCKFSIGNASVFFEFRFIMHGY